MLIVVDGGAHPATSVSAGICGAYQIAIWAYFWLFCFRPVESLVQRFETRSTSMTQADTGVGDGRAAWFALENENAIGILQEARQSVQEQLATQRMNPGVDSDDLLRMFVFCARWTDIVTVWLQWEIPSLMTHHLRGITPKYSFGRGKRYIYRNFGPDVIRGCVKYTYIDGLSRPCFKTEATIDGPGVTMPTAHARIKCFQCQQNGHRKRDSLAKSRGRNPNGNASAAQRGRR